MQYLGLAVVVGFLALLIVLVALRLLFGGHWLLGWLRGNLGLLFLAAAGLVGLLAYEVSRYHAIPADRTLAEVSFAQQKGRRYEARISHAGRQYSVLLEGDLWQLELRQLRWEGLGDFIGLEPGYRLESLSGRYLAVEQQAGSRFAEALLVEQPLDLPLTQWLDRVQIDLPFVALQHAKISLMPIADGAGFAVELAPTGLLVRPLNEAASKAVSDWRVE
jgi:hypothetical protein